MKKKSKQSIELRKVDKEQSNDTTIVTNINDAPFNLIETKDKILITIGHEVLKKCESMEDAVKYIESKPWDLILNATAIYAEYISKVRKEKENDKTEDE